MKRSLTPRPRYTTRMILRPFRRRDVDSVLEAALGSLNDLNRWLPWAHPSYNRSDATAFIKDSVAAWTEARAFDFTMRYRDDLDRHLGNISVWFTSRAAMIGEIGYWVRSDETDHGIATEAVVRVLQVAFEELKMHRVVLRIAVGNNASERIAEKLGFTKEGLLREELRVNGVWLDHTIWGLLEREYRSMRNHYVAAGWE